MKATILHNPRCSKSRAALSLLEAAGCEVTVVDYLRDPPAADVLARLYEKAGIAPAAGLRANQAGTKALLGADDAAVLAAMVADPRLIERPLVETIKGAAICRPPERVHTLL